MYDKYGIDHGSLLMYALGILNACTFSNGSTLDTRSKLFFFSYLSVSTFIKSPTLMQLLHTQLALSPFRHHSTCTACLPSLSGIMKESEY